MSNPRVTTFPSIVFCLSLLSCLSALRPSIVYAQSEQSNESAKQGQREKGSTEKDQGKPKKADKFKVIRKVKAIYPEEAVEKGVQGNVRVKFTVSENGVVIKAKAISGPKLLRQAALDALFQTRFTNAFKKNVNAKMTYYFKLLKDEAMISDSEAEEADNGVSTDEEGVKLIDKVEPVYPQEAKDKGIEGEVVVEASVNENGEVIEVSVMDGPELLHQAAIEAAKKYRFLNPHKESVSVTITINFKL